MSSDLADRGTPIPLPRASRRSFLTALGATSSVLLLTACGGGASAPKPTEAPKPATDAAKPTAAAPAAPVAKPADAAAKPAASPAAAAPAAKTAGALPDLKGQTLKVLQWQNFIPELDPLQKKQTEEIFMKETGAQVELEFIDQNQIQAKAAAAIQSGNGPDLWLFAHNWAQLYSDALVDVTDVAEEVQKQTGEFFPMFQAYAKADGKYLGVPHDFIGLAVHYRKSWFKDVGLEQYPKTFEELWAAGKKLKANGHPLGQSLGHSIGDPLFFCYPLVWAYGGQEVDANGKAALSSPGTLAAVKALKDVWQEAYDETGLAWDDSSNNRAFLAGTISDTQNGASIWWVARKDKAPFFDDIGLALMPGGPKGQYTMGQAWSYSIAKWSKNVDAAKAYIRWMMSDPIWMQWFEVAGSFVNGVGPRQDDNPIWAKFPPVTQVFKGAPATGRPIGWPGPANQKASLAVSKYIIVDMFAKAVQGESPEAAVAWADNELKQIYG